MGAIPSEKGGERFPQLFSPRPQKAGFGGFEGGAAAGGNPWTSSARGGVRERKGGWGRGGRRGLRTLALSRQCMWRDREGRVIAVAALRWLGPPVWPLCGATCTGATKAICRAMWDGATKRATPCK